MTQRPPKCVHTWRGASHPGRHTGESSPGSCFKQGEGNKDLGPMKRREVQGRKRYKTDVPLLFCRCQGGADNRGDGEGNAPPGRCMFALTLFRTWAYGAQCSRVSCPQTVHHVTACEVPFHPVLGPGEVGAPLVSQSWREGIRELL